MWIRFSPCSDIGSMLFSMGGIPPTLTFPMANYGPECLTKPQFVLCKVAKLHGLLYHTVFTRLPSCVGVLSCTELY